MSEIIKDEEFDFTKLINNADLSSKDDIDRIYSLITEREVCLYFYFGI